MLLLGLFAVLLAISAGIGYLAYQGNGGWGAAISLLGAIVGGLIAVIGQELFRQQESRAIQHGLLEALKTEVRQNLKINGAGKSEKRRLYLTSAWEAFRPHVGILKDDVAGLLLEGYAAAYMHQQALKSELINKDQLGALESYSQVIFTHFSAVEPLKEWKKG